MSIFNGFDSKDATLFFFLCLALGVASIVNGILLPWIPIAIVVVYGAILLLTAVRQYQAHTEMIKNSPYFLAFSFFLISLYVVFQGFDESVPDQQALMLQQMGTALLPTVFGLGMRQALFAWDPDAHQQEALRRSIEADLMRDAAAFRKAQQRLTEIAREFAEQREILLKAERQSAEAYMASFQSAAQVFREGAESYPKAIETALDGLSAKTVPLIAKLEAAMASLSSFDSQAPRRLSETLDALNPQLQRTAAGLEAAISATNEMQRRLTDLPAAADGELRRVGAEVSAALATAANDLRAHVRDLGTEVASTREGIRTLTGGLRKDLADIDGVVEQLVETLERRMSELASSAGAR